MSLSNLTSKYYKNLADTKSSYSCCYNSSGTFCYSNVLSKVLTFLPLVTSTATLFSTFGSLSTLGALSSGTSGSSGAKSINSVFTYGNDNKTDYAEKAVEELTKELDAKTSSLNKNQSEYNTLNGTGVGSVSQLFNTMNAEEGKTEQAKEIYNAIEDKSSPEAKQKYAEWKAKEDAYIEANKAYKEAKARKKKLEEDINNLQTEIKDINDKIEFYQQLDVANGDNLKDDRATSAEATKNKNIQDDTLQLANARQLINEFASARRAYEAKVENGTATVADKKKLKQIAKRFTDEYDNGTRENSCNDNTIKNAYDLIKDYIKKLDE